MVEPFSVRIMRFKSSRKRNMPSKNTSVISARVKNETALKFTQIAENRGITVSKLLDEIAEKIDEETLFEKGVTPDGYAVSEDFESEKYGSKIERGFKELTEKGYPDQAKRMYEEQIYEQMHNMPKYNPKRACFDEGC